MPELPEVEIARRNLARWLKGRRVIATDSEPTRTFRGADRAAFSLIKGSLLKAERKGKYLLLSFERNQGLLAHLGMTGKFVRRDKGANETYSKARFVLDNQKVIHFRDPRLFGRLEPVKADSLWSLPVIQALGVDPLNQGLTSTDLRNALGETRLDLKVALMDQSKVSGLGNIHAAESLFRSGIHPARKCTSLTEADWKKLSQAILKAIAFALDQEDEDEIRYVEEPGSTNPFWVYGKAKTLCRKCRKSEIESFVQAGRTTFFCPHCQPRGA